MYEKVNFVYTILILKNVKNQTSEMLAMPNLYILNLLYRVCLSSIQSVNLK